MGADLITKILTYGIPIIIAITVHEAAHGFVALRYGDDTALRAGRVTFNPLKHIDLFGTILLPGFLLWGSTILLGGSPVIFGYAKPVPVNFGRLNNPRRDMVLVAAAGPGVNILLAIASGLLMHFIGIFPASLQFYLSEMLSMSMLINVVLAVFNMMPLPPLDGGRVAVGLLPNSLALPLARLEPHGFLILLALLLLPPLLFNTHFFAEIILPPVKIILGIISVLTGLS